MEAEALVSISSNFGERNHFFEVSVISRQKTVTK